MVNCRCIVFVFVVATASATFSIKSSTDEDGQIKPINVADVENSVDPTDENGEKLCEGDMVCDITTAEWGSDRNAINGDRYRWKKEDGIVTVPYIFDSSLADKGKMQVLASAADYAGWTCIKFVERTNQADYIKFYNGTGCKSKIGRMGGEQLLSLADSCNANKGTASHEMMHAMGFFHEQSRNDRDKYVTVRKDLVQKGHKFNFDICNSCTDPKGMPYDYRSVMHYSATAFTEHGDETITPKTGRSDQIGQRAGLCTGDIKKLNQMYNCGGVTASPTKPNKGVLPCNQPYDHWSNCEDFLRQCTDPKENYRILRKCPITCLGKRKGDAYDRFSDCMEKASNLEIDHCSTNEKIKEHCLLSCGEKSKLSGSKLR